MNITASATAAALATCLPVNALLAISAGIAALVLLIYIGIALPAVWSTRPTRRKAAAAVLEQLLGAWTSVNRN
jgi:hypothetical protein